MSVSACSGVVAYTEGGVQEWGKDVVHDTEFVVESPLSGICSSSFAVVVVEDIVYMEILFNLDIKLSSSTIILRLYLSYITNVQPYQR